MPSSLMLCAATVACCLLAAPRVSHAKLVTFSNVQPRLDSATGQILELGDGVHCMPLTDSTA